MGAFFAQTKTDIGAFSEHYLHSIEGDLLPVGAWGADSLQRLGNFSTQGKMMRGGLVCLSGQMLGADNRVELLRVAAAIELIHAGLLIHDDIMDQDRLRRGALTLYAQYEAQGQLSGIEQLERYGQSLAICAGDLAFFLAQEMVSEVQLATVRRLVGREIAKVCLAQMDDVVLGLSPAMPTQEQIMAVYRHKTARYTFSLPLMAGAILAGADQQTVDHLCDLGEALGLIFQIRDDSLNLFGDSAVTGKPVGSDIREGKKTLFYFHLISRVESVDKDRLNQIYGRADVADDDIAFVLGCLERYQVTADITGTMRELEKQASSILSHIDMDVRYRDIFDELLEYSLTRSS